MRRTLVIVGIVLLVAAGGVFAYTRLRPPSATAQGDPALRVALAIGTLERSETYRLSDEQVASILPLLRVLRDTDPDDVEASRALVREIDSYVTTEQRAELDRLREQAQQRRQAQSGPRVRRPGAPGAGGVPGGPAGPGGPGIFGPGGPGGGPGAVVGRSRAEIRRRVLVRLIEILESRH